MHAYTQKKAAGQAVFDHVLRKLEILERDYFGLQYEDEQKTLVSFRVPHLGLDP